MGSRNPSEPKEPPRKFKRKPAPRELGCRVRVGRAAPRLGTATLTDDELRFHTGRTGREGTDFNWRIPYADITKLEVDATRGIMTVSGAEEGDVVLELGRHAAEWKKLIEDRPTMLRLLGLGKKSRVDVLGVDDEELNEALAPLARGDEDLDAIFVMAEHRADLAQLSALGKRLRRGGAVWVVHGPKLRPSEIVAAGTSAGLVEAGAFVLSRGHDAVKLTRL